jgi:hypothetical protein
VWLWRDQTSLLGVKVQSGTIPKNTHAVTIYTRIANTPLLLYYPGATHVWGPSKHPNTFTRHFEQFSAFVDEIEVRYWGLPALITSIITTFSTQSALLFNPLPPTLLYSIPFGLFIIQWGTLQKPKSGPEKWKQKKER